MTRRGLLARMGLASAALVSGRFARGAPAGADEALSCSLDVAEGTASIGAPTATDDSSPEVTGSWSEPFPGPSTVIGVHAMLLHTGKVLLMEGRKAAVWDPVSGAGRRVDPPENLFCAGHCVLGDGRVFLAGGAKVGPPPNWTTLFDPVAETWTYGPTMRQGRWYPTATVLPSGTDVVITTGDFDRSGEPNEDVEVFSAGDGTMSVVGTRKIGLYPHQKVVPDGRVLLAGPATADVGLLDPGDWSWSSVPPLRRSHHNGGGVLLPGGPGGPHELMLFGSTFTTGATVESFDVDRPEDGWTRRADLPAPRAHMNGVLLPDGKVLGVGGSHDAGNLHESLLYDPVADTWTPVASQVQVRGYHSTALLLPDGRVLSAGDNLEPGGLDTLELYSPPYLYRGPRPKIGTAPTAITWGAEFDVTTPSAVARVVLVRPGAVTHSNDMEQRHVELAFTAADGVLRVAAPPSPAVAPSGWYMLFLLNRREVPSRAGWVRVA